MEVLDGFSERRNMVCEIGIKTPPKVLYLQEMFRRGIDIC
jgi:hypothetical protein